MKLFEKMKIFGRKSLGEKGEELATDYLKKRGFSVLERNFKNRKGYNIGEIDIVAEKEGEIVFVEVKTRELEKYENTLPEENISHKKLLKLSRISQIYLKARGWQDRNYRFDAVSVWISTDSKKAKLKHIPSIFI